AGARLLRPGLTYRCFRVDSPYSDAVTVVALEGEDREGYCFSAGSACRETRGQSWTKALLEAVHGRHYVRHLKSEVASGQRAVPREPNSFAEHAVYYSFHPGRLRDIVLARPAPHGGRAYPGRHEGLPELCERLGPQRPVLVRNLTPTALAQEGLDW